MDVLLLCTVLFVPGQQKPLPKYSLTCTLAGLMWMIVNTVNRHFNVN